jgi:hypothetical protein
MTIKEAVLKSLEDLGGITNYLEVCNNIIAKKYFDFGAAKTPAATISASLGEYIRNGDTRVKRIKQEGGGYGYYLTKNEETIGLDVLSGATVSTTTVSTKRQTKQRAISKEIYINS